MRTFLDLFCGCGGFSLGLERAGLRCLAAIDVSPEAVVTFRTNLPRVPVGLDRDLTRFGPEKLSALLGGVKHVDLIVGGPPCQGFSNVRQVDAANHGPRVRRDKRRYLFRVFLDYVQHFQPKIFVMENVLGLQSAAKGKFFTAVQAEARALGYRVHPQVEEAWRLGVPQKRRRQLIVGVRQDVPGRFPTTLRPAPRALPADMAGPPAADPVDPALSLFGEDEVAPAAAPCCPTLWDAIGDLPPLEAGTGERLADYDLTRRAAFLAERGPLARHYLENVLEIGRAQRLTAHFARPQSERDLGDFARLREGEHSAEALARGEILAFPYNRECFEDRYKRQHREELCSTIVAHLSKDGLMFIHPTQNRSLTPREAARVQSFPDWFRFPVPRTHQFRLIGNAVPPLVAEAVGVEVMKFLDESTSKNGPIPFDLSPLPENDREAVKWILPLLNVYPRVLQQTPNETFKRAWYAIGFLYTGLHPDSAHDHGKAICRSSDDNSCYAALAEPKLIAPYYERSGWPVVLAPIVAEAWRRYKAGQLDEGEFYCSDAQMAGVCYRSPQLVEEVREGRRELVA